jgi:hypothetical protein
VSLGAGVGAVNYRKKSLALPGIKPRPPGPYLVAIQIELGVSSRNTGKYVPPSAHTEITGIAYTSTNSDGV